MVREGADGDGARGGLPSLRRRDERRQGWCLHALLGGSGSLRRRRGRDAPAAGPAPGVDHVPVRLRGTAEADHPVHEVLRHARPGGSPRRETGRPAGGRAGGVRADRSGAPALGKTLAARLQPGGAAGSSGSARDGPARGMRSAQAGTRHAIADRTEPGGESGERPGSLQGRPAVDRGGAVALDRRRRDDRGHFGRVRQGVECRGGATRGCRRGGQNAITHSNMRCDTPWVHESRI